MKKFITYILFFGSAALLNSCSNFQAPYTVNTGTDIESEVSNKINDLDIKLFQYLKGGEFDALYAISSQDLVKRLKNDTTGLLPAICRGLQNMSYGVFDEFYITSILPNTPVSIATFKSRNDCKVSFIAPSAKTDLSILAVGDSAAEYLLSLLYTKSGSDWQLHDFNAGLYSVDGLTAPDLYVKAQQYYKQNDLVDAANYMSLCKQCLNPIDTNWHYNDEEIMARYANKLIKEANKKFGFPIKATSIKTEPVIFSISLQLAYGGLHPFIKYTSTIPIKDTAALREENLQLRKFAHATFAPMHANHSIVLYRVFDKMPDGTNAPLSYSFVEEL